MWCHNNLAHYAGEAKLCQASLEGCPWWGLPHHLGGRWWWLAWRVRDWAMILRLHDVCKRLEPWGGVSSHQMATCVKNHETIWNMFWIVLVFTPKKIGSLIRKRWVTSCLTHPQIWCPQWLEHGHPVFEAFSQKCRFQNAEDSMNSLWFHFGVVWSHDP